MNVLQQLTIRGKFMLLLSVVVAGILLFGVMAFSVLSRVKVNGPSYKEIVQGKDLIADILPPPVYILESYLTALQMLDAAPEKELPKLLDKSKKLQKDFEDRENFWKNELPENHIKSLLTREAQDPAKEFFALLHGSYLTALRAGDRPKAKQILEREMVPVYEKHLAAIESVVSLVNEKNTKSEDSVRSMIRSRTLLLFAVGFLTLLVLAALIWKMANALIRPVVLTVEALEGVASGDLRAHLDVQSKDEMGRLAHALNKTVEGIRMVLESERVDWAVVAQNQKKAALEKENAIVFRQKVDRLLETVNAAAQGDLTRTISVKGEDAVGQMGESLERFFDALRANLQSISQNSQTLASASEELSSVSQQMSSNAEETATQSNVVSAAAEQVSKNLQTVATGSEEMTASIKEIAKNAVEAAKVASAAVKVAETTNTTIGKLGDSSAEIGNVIKVITSIAQQTNLLALNATIEAARAGEAGKGFAVVANEVKELAKETAKATEDISQRIVAIQSDTEGAVGAIKQISGVINQINDISNTIASAVEEQTATTNEISRNVNEAAKGSSEIARSITGVATAAQGVTHGASDSQKAAQELAHLAADLQKLVSRYQSDRKPAVLKQVA